MYISATALAVWGVFSLPLGLTGLFSVHFRDPRFLLAELPGPSFFSVFFCVAFEVAFLRVLWPTWPQHGPNLGPKRPPKSRKIYKKRDHILDVVFQLIFDGFWEDFGRVLEATMVLKIDNNCTKHVIQ